MSSNGKLRIIGGKWKSRQIAFPALPNLRPTPDMVREMVFNWLGQDLSGQSCLDLFAGSGALGFEAASRNARKVDLVEINRNASQLLKKNINLLGGASQISAHNTSANSFLKHSDVQYDVIFLDPPFNQNCIDDILCLITKHDCCAKNGLIYIETSSSEKHLSIPPSWNIIRQSVKGMVKSTLIEPKPDDHD